MYGKNFLLSHLDIKFIFPLRGKRNLNILSGLKASPRGWLVFTQGWLVIPVFRSLPVIDIPIPKAHPTT